MTSSCRASGREGSHASMALDARNGRAISANRIRRKKIWNKAAGRMF